MNFRQVAEEYLSYGLAVLPVHADKRPAAKEWKSLMTVPPTDAQMEAWTAANPFGIGIICGKASNNLICLDIDTKHDPAKKVHTELSELLQSWGHGGIIAKCVTESTPNGGFHVLFHAPESRPNEKLARAAGSPEAMIETRGEGGYFVAAPTEGWTLKKGDFSKVPNLTADEVDLIYSASRSLDRHEPPRETFSTIPHQGDGQTPLDAYNASQSAEDMAAMLRDAGWRILGSHGRNIHLSRPDKGGRTTSATIHAEKRTFYVFTTSTEFEAGKGYSPAAILAILKYRGDFTETARQLSAQGYGDRQRQQPAAAPTVTKVSETKTLDDLQARIVKYYENGDPKGASTPWQTLTDMMSVRRGMLNIVTGIPSHGKSSVVDQIMVHLAQNEGWKIDMFSPEHYPHEVHARRLLQMATGKPFFGPARMTKEELLEESYFLGNHFRFIDSTDEVDLDFIISECEKGNADALVIDPWNEIEITRPKEQTESEYIGSSLRKLRKFARKKNISVWVVAHPTKIPKEEKGKERRIPDLYDINGSANWYNKADNGMTIYRNFTENYTSIHVQKIKFSWDGHLGEVRLNFNPKSTGYDEQTAGEDFIGGAHSRSTPVGDR